MPQTAPELALVALQPTPRHDPIAGFAPAGPGWFDSSWELRRGLDVREGWSDDERVSGWIETFLAAQRSGRTVSPSARTAIA